MNRKKLMALGISMIMAVSATACSSKETEDTDNSSVLVDVENPSSDEVDAESAFMGTVSPEQEVYVVPLVAGTVTEVNYSVGDTVSEGDVLFKIDDEAGQLQLESAEAAYNTAAAGAKAATGGARDLQNYQTEQSIDTLEDNLDTLDSTVDSLGKQWDTLNDTLTSLNSQLSQAQQAVTQTKTAYDQAVTAAGGTYEQLKSQRDMLTTELETLKSTGSAIDTNPSSTGEAGNSYETTYQNLQTRIAAIDAQIAPVTAAKTAYEQAQTTVTTLQTKIAEVQSSKTQVESGYDTAKANRDTVAQNLETAKGTYSITKNEVYPETDATYSAQLNAASVGIDSANYQLDMYTITAPISGVVDAVNVEVDSLTSSSSPAFVISNKDAMTVTFYVAEAAKDALNVGDTIRIERNGIEAEAQITEVGTMANAQTKTFEVKATILGDSADFENGVSVKIYAVTDKETGKLSVPYDCLTFSGGTSYLYTVEDGKIVKKTVTVGLMNDDRAVIEDGIDADAMVVTNWSDKLRNNVDAEISTLNGQPYSGSGSAGSSADSEEDTQADENSDTRAEEEEE